MAEPVRCSHCGVLLETARYVWEGDPWCESCLRNLAVDPVWKREAGLEERPPIPWEIAANGRSLVSTWRMLCGRPREFFARLRPTAGRALVFAVLTTAVSSALSLPGNVWLGEWAAQLLAAQRPRAQGSADTAAAPETADAAVTEQSGIGPRDAGLFFVLQWGALVAQTMGAGALLYASLIMVGEPRGVSAVFGIQGYAMGASLLLMAPPPLGAALMPFWQMRLQALGLHLCLGVGIIRAWLAAALATLLYYILAMLAWLVVELN